MGMARSADHRRIFSASFAGRIYESMDGGANWTAITAVGADNFCNLCGSADCSTLIITKNWFHYLSTDGGATFTQENLSGADYSAAFMSSDGSRITALGDGQFTQYS